MAEACCCKDGCKSTASEKDNTEKKLIIRLSLSAISFFAALLLGNNIYLLLLSFVLSGTDIIIKAAKNIAKGELFDENFLMSVATVGAFIIGEYPESAAVMLFYQAGELLQELSVGRSRKAITSLMDIRPDHAVLSDGSKVSPEEVKIGDTIIVKPGERVPLDGKIVSGNASMDTSALTGESIPRDVVEGDIVLSGYVSINGALTIQVTKPYSESTVAKILELTEHASERKSQTERFITRFAKIYTPVVTSIAAIIAIVPPIILHLPFSEWIYKGLVFLVVSCPCALVISIPLGFFGGIGRASKNGILIKGSNFLEAIRIVDTIVFDKTGTLTKGVFNVKDVKGKTDNLLELAAYAEGYSNHPIAQSIVKAYGKEIDKSRISDYTEIAGKGVSVKIDGKTVLAGNEKLIENAEHTEETAVHLSVDGEYAGYITIADEIKPDAEKTVKALKGMGIKQTIMLTGDNKYIGQKIAEQTGIDKGYYSLLPGDKVSKLEEIKKASKSAAFVGDGINDAPALALADVGIAMGGLGSDAAIEAADIVIMTDEPSRIIDAIKTGQMTRAIVWQNIIFSLGIKALVMILATVGIASMWYAVFADVGVALLAVMNSMRLIIIKSPKAL